MACTAQVKVEVNHYSGMWGRCTRAGMALPHLLKGGEEGVNGTAQDDGHTCGFCMNFKILPSDPLYGYIRHNAYYVLIQQTTYNNQQVTVSNLAVKKSEEYGQEL